MRACVYELLVRAVFVPLLTLVGACACVCVSEFCAHVCVSALACEL